MLGEFETFTGSGGYFLSGAYTSGSPCGMVKMSFQWNQPHWVEQIMLQSAPELIKRHPSSLKIWYRYSGVSDYIRNH